MATIDIRRNHSLTPDQLRARAEELAKAMEEKLGIRWRWDGDQQIKFDAPSGAAKGTTGVVNLSPSSVHVAIDLPFLLRALKGSVESRVNQKLDDVIGRAS